MEKWDCGGFEVDDKSRFSRPKDGFVSFWLELLMPNEKEGFESAVEDFLKPNLYLFVEGILLALTIKIARYLITINTIIKIKKIN